MVLSHPNLQYFSTETVTVHPCVCNWRGDVHVAQMLTARTPSLQYRRGVKTLLFNQSKAYKTV